MTKLEVHSYSIDQLKQLIADASQTSPELVAQKLHYYYFEGYCDSIGVRTIVVERNYVDQHYLEDFAAYYVRCYHSYRRFCTRLHFFQFEFNQQNLENSLEGDDQAKEIEAQLQDKYLGFVVIKPLPQTVVGRTCLAHYPTEDRRYYPIVREYKANLCGIELSVQSLAFQEQDRVVAACATSALWSVFHGTGKQFQHIIPSPVEITRAATEKLPIETRTFPSQGLSTAMMAHAIRHVGLEPFLVNVTDDYVLRSTVYAFLRGHIPMILGIELWDLSNCPHRSLGFHAVAATGFSLGREEAASFGETGFLLRASRVDKLYVHDDQVGPFARMAFDGGQIIVGNDPATGNTIEVVSISSSWIGSDGKIGSVRARPTILLIPVYHKIRIPFGVIHDTVVSFDSFVEALRERLPIPYDGRLEWDIYLTTNNALKAEVRKDNDAKGAYFRDVLLEPMPKYIWRASALETGKPVLDLLFDATDIEQGPFFVRSIEHDEELSILLRVVSKIPEIEQVYGTKPEWKIIQWFKEQNIPEPQ